MFLKSVFLILFIIYDVLCNPFSGDFEMRLHIAIKEAKCNDYSVFNDTIQEPEAKCDDSLNGSEPRQEGEDEKIDYLETWRGFESVLAKGLTRGIGVSNFNLQQLKRLLANCKVVPAMNQVEVNLNLGQPDLINYCQSKNIVVTGFSPFGTMIPSRTVPDSPEPKIDNPTMMALAIKYGKTVSQIALRYLHQRGIVIIPKTITKSRVVENASIFDFKLDGQDFDTLSKFDNGYRTVRPVFWQPIENYPFDKVALKEKVEIPLNLRKWKNGAKENID